MRNLLAATAITFALVIPAAAQTSSDEVEELLALSNSSAAERLVGDTSEGEPMIAEIKFALGEMSAAERRTFFEADETSRLDLIAAKRKLAAGSDSAAESN